MGRTNGEPQAGIQIQIHGLPDRLFGLVGDGEPLDVMAEVGGQDG